MQRKWIRALVIIGCALSFGACGAGVFEAPTVSLESVRLAGLGLRGGTLLVDLAVTNPNHFTLSAEALHYDLEIAQSGATPDTTWLNLASGTFAEPFSVGSGETSSVQVPVEFTYEGLGGAAASLLRAGTFNYRAKGTVDVSTPLGPYQVPFQRGGMITLMGGL